MRVTICLGEPLWRFTGKRRLQILLRAGSRLDDALAALSTFSAALYTFLCPEQPGRRACQIAVNAFPVSWDAVAGYPLEEGDVIHILSPAAGGSDLAPLPRAFYDRDTVQVAQDLLGALLVRELDEHLLVGRIVETEAYVGPDDRASHASVGRTERNQVMFGPPGYAYVYLIYGVHHCLNVVTERAGFPAAVLIRAIEPLQGVEIMRARRGGRADTELTNGPAKLCQALGIDLSLYGHDLTQGATLWIATGQPVARTEIVSGPRVGVRGDTRARTIPWRFAIRGNPYVSKPRPDA